MYAYKGEKNEEQYYKILQKNSDKYQPHAYCWSNHKLHGVIASVKYLS